MDKKTFVNRIWDALDFSYGAQWFKDFCDGNEDIVCLGTSDKLAFMKFKGEERYFSVAALPGQLSKGDPALAEIDDATARLYAQWAEVEDFSYNVSQMLFWDVDKPENGEFNPDAEKHWWLITALADIKEA